MENYECDFFVNGEPGVGGHTNNADCGNKHRVMTLEKHQQNNRCQWMRQ